MKTYTIQEALQLDDGMTLPSIEGKLTWVGPVVQKEHPQNGPWHFQKFMLADPELGKDDPNSAIYATIKNRDDLTPLKFKILRFESYTGSKGLEGILKSVRDYNGKTYNDLAVHVAPTVLDEETGTEGAPATGGVRQEPQPAAAKEPVKAVVTHEHVYKRKTPVVDDYVPQTTSYLAGPALVGSLNDPNGSGEPDRNLIAAYIVEMYFGREIAIPLIRDELARQSAAEQGESNE
jgi:hypothetical protein